MLRSCCMEVYLFVKHIDDDGDDDDDDDDDGSSIVEEDENDNKNAGHVQCRVSAFNGLM